MQTLKVLAVKESIINKYHIYHQKLVTVKPPFSKNTILLNKRTILLSLTILFQMFRLCFAQSINKSELSSKSDTIEGWIKSESSQLPLEAVKVTDPAHGTYTFTDSSGHFLLQVPHRGNGNLITNLVGYVPREIKYEQGRLVRIRETIELNRETRGVPKLIIGDSIPEEFWNMILPIANSKEGRTKITLEEHRNSPIIVIDFWSRACGPCIEALDKWQTLKDSIGDGVTIISAYVGFPESVDSFMASRGWTMPAVVGEESEILNAYLFNQRGVLGGMVLIVNGYLHSSPSIKNINVAILKLLVEGKRVKLPTKSPQFLHQGGV